MDPHAVSSQIILQSTGRPRIPFLEEYQPTGNGWIRRSQFEQAKRFKERNEDYRKIWKLSPMDVEAQARWYDYSRACDAMFEATDTPESPWYMVPSNDQRKARLNCITHFLSLIPDEEVPREPIKFPKRQKQGDYVEHNYPYRVVPQKF